MTDKKMEIYRFCRHQSGHLMSVIREQWKQGNSPVAEGIFYADDSCRSARLDGNGKLIIGDCVALPSDLEFLELFSYESGSLPCPHGVIRWGGGPWEGEGWVALEDSFGDLAWLLHLDDSEAFTEVSFRDDVIEAMAQEYPVRTVLLIPALAPHQSVVKSDG